MLDRVPLSASAKAEWLQGARARGKAAAAPPAAALMANASAVLPLRRRLTEAAAADAPCP